MRNPQALALGLAVLVVVPSHARGETGQPNSPGDRIGATEAVPRLTAGARMFDPDGTAACAAEPEAAGKAAIVIGLSRESALCSASAAFAPLDRQDAFARATSVRDISDEELEHYAGALFEIRQLQGRLTAQKAQTVATQHPRLAELYRLQVAEILARYDLAPARFNRITHRIELDGNARSAVRETVMEKALGI